MKKWVPRLLSSFFIAFSIGNLSIPLNLLFAHVNHPRIFVLEVWAFCVAAGCINVLQWLQTTPLIRYGLIIFSISIAYLGFASLFQWMPINGLSIAATFVGFAIWYVGSWLVYWGYSRWLANGMNRDLHHEM